jgi:hypothetical protein
LWFVSVNGSGWPDRGEARVDLDVDLHLAHVDEPVGVVGDHLLDRVEAGRLGSGGAGGPEPRGSERRRFDRAADEQDDRDLDRADDEQHQDRSHEGELEQGRAAPVRAEAASPGRPAPHMLDHQVGHRPPPVLPSARITVAA